MMPRTFSSARWRNANFDHVAEPVNSQAGFSRSPEKQYPIATTKVHGGSQRIFITLVTPRALGSTTGPTDADSKSPGYELSVWLETNIPRSFDLNALMRQKQWMPLTKVRGRKQRQAQDEVMLKQDSHVRRLKRPRSSKAIQR